MGVTDSDDPIIQIYSPELIALSSSLPEERRLRRPDFSATAVSPVCGSKVTIDLSVTGGRIGDFGFALEACALTRAVIAMIDTHIRGKTLLEIKEIRAGMERILGGDTKGSSWPEMALFSAAKDYPSRHNALMLPFEAIEKAFLSRKDQT